MKSKFQGILEFTEDGELKMYNKAEFMRFIEQFGKGRRFTYDVKAIATGEKNWIRAYYFAELVEKFLFGYEQHGEILDKDEAHQRMKKLYPPLRIIVESELPGAKKQVKTKSIMDEDFSPADFWDYIDFLAQYAAEHFDIIINPPSSPDRRQSTSIDPVIDQKPKTAIQNNTNFLKQSST